MSRPTFDLDVLRSFVLGLELGSFARAADRIGRSTSAVSAQLKKLEEQVGGPLVRKAGRGLQPTPAGEIMLSYARRLLALNDEAASAVRGADLSGGVRIGIQEDFGESILPQVLGLFTRAHPRVEVRACIARNAELIEGIRAGELDLALAWDGGQQLPHSTSLGHWPLCWIGTERSEEGKTPGSPLPLALFEAPCLMRSTALAALDNADHPWRIAFSSPSLSGIWAAVGADLGVTVRIRATVPGHLRVLEHLPALPPIELKLHQSDADPADAVRRLATILQQSLHELAQGAGV